MRTRRGLALSAAVLSTTLLLSACSGDDEPQAAGGGDPLGVSEGHKLTSYWPLTGEPVGADETSERTHPVLVTKIDNSSSSSPQEGLGEAELVVEQLVEGGTTRLAAFFYRDLPTEVGPVRSMRASDVGIVEPAGGSMVTSGGAAPTVARIRGAGIPILTEGSKGFYRASDRSAPYNLMANLKEVGGSGEPTRPPDYLPFGDASDNPQGKPARTIAATFSGARTSTWQLTDGAYDLTNGYAAEGDRFRADTVLVLKAEVGDAGYLDPAGNPVPETIFQGSGDATLFHDGRGVSGTWSKDGFGGALRLRTGDDEPLVVPPGKTWIELIPADGGSVSSGK
ncbi:DUF3048 domain-containing protein [uncultured Nocardioides sp.]|uniref:DUF3048 domain-containing protein n=1 Tax=uncultured Nocardioides sp. TaxID=198441 RepID=UPI002623576A|nr:DUF3048 domain-containing protein [uncultured Nocardioides sp.]